MKESETLTRCQNIARANLVTRAPFLVDYETLFKSLSNKLFNSSFVDDQRDNNRRRRFVISVGDSFFSRRMYDKCFKRKTQEAFQHTLLGKCHVWWKPAIWRNLFLTQTFPSEDIETLGHTILEPGESYELVQQMASVRKSWNESGEFNEANYRTELTYSRFFDVTLMIKNASLLSSW